jgi:hypothetical protein
VILVVGRGILAAYRQEQKGGEVVVCRHSNLV